jgi:hypothetical protein
VEGNGTCKHFRLLQYGNNYCRKRLYSTGPCRKLLYTLADVRKVPNCLPGTKRSSLLAITFNEEEKKFYNIDIRLIAVIESLDNGKAIRETRDADVQVPMYKTFYGCNL